MQAALECRLADTGDVGRVAGREAFDVAQHDGRPPLGGQFIQRMFQRALELAIERLRFGAELSRLRQRDDWVIAVGIGLGTRWRASR
jgi:hypothetical protein